MDASLFFYIVLASAAVLAALWYFVIAPLEWQKHERKLKILQRKIKNHREEMEKSKAPLDPNSNDDAAN